MTKLQEVKAIIDVDNMSADEKFCYQMNIPIQKLGSRDYFEIIDSYYKVFGKGILITDMSNIMNNILEALDNEVNLNDFKERIRVTCFRGR